MIIKLLSLTQSSVFIFLKANLILDQSSHLILNSAPGLSFISEKYVSMRKILQLTAEKSLAGLEPGFVGEKKVHLSMVCQLLLPHFLPLWISAMHVKGLQTSIINSLDKPWLLKQGDHRFFKLIS